MRRTLRPALLALVAAALLASTAGAADQKGTTYVSTTGRYALTIPTTWKLVPRSVPLMKALIAKLAKKGSTTTLASAYSQILASSAGRTGMTYYDLQAFAWPADPSTPVPTEVNLSYQTLKRSYGVKDLPALGAVWANSLASSKGSRVTKPKVVQLNAGPADLIYAAIPGGQFTTGVQMYVIPHGKRVYELSFTIDVRYLEQASLFAQIAKAFKVA